MADVAAVLQLEVESGGVAELERGRRCERDHERSPDLVEALVGALRQGKHGVLFPRALRPVLQADEYQAGVLPVAAEAEAVDGEHAAHEIFLVLEEVVARLIEGPLRELTRCARRRRHLDEQNALILIRQEGSRHAHEQQAHRHHDDPIHQEVAPGAPRDMSDPALVAAIHPVEAAIEPAEEPALALVGLRDPRLEERRAQ